MTNTNNIYYGMLGSSSGVLGIILATNDLLTITSIICTALGFIISVVIPGIINLVKHFKGEKLEFSEKDLEEKIKAYTEIIEKLEEEIKKNKEQK